MKFKGLSEVFSAALIALVILTCSTIAYTLYSKSLKVKCLGLEEEVNLLKFKSKVGILIVSTKSNTQTCEILLYNYGVKVVLEKVISNGGYVSFKVEVYESDGWVESKTIPTGKIARITIYSNSTIKNAILCFKGGVHVKVEIE